MKRYLKELIILLIQLFMFYIFPLFAGPTDAMGMLFLIIVATLLLSLMIGMLFAHKVKYLYPIVIAVLFIPSVFIYYNGSAMVHSIWYLVIASIGLLVGTVIRFLIGKIGRKKS